MAVPAAYFDANIDTPVEVEGSPAISTDEVTGSRIIKRSYAQRKTLWNRLAYASPDPFITGARLGPENPGQIVGPVLFFDRTFYEVPESRVEPREISFPYPGRSAVEYSKITALPIGWNPYGAAAPQTLPVLARVEFSYAAVTSLSQDPRTLFNVPVQSRLTFNGATVDYSGQVYVSVGNVSIPQGSGQPPVVEPRWQLAGSVGGFVSGQDWIYSVNISRWRGPVWQMEVVKVPNFILP
jgi:hypothetical protein